MLLFSLKPLHRCATWSG